MENCLTPERLKLMLAGELSSEECVSADEHIRNCQICLRQLEELTSFQSVVEEIVDNAMHSGAADTTRLPVVPGFALRRVLGTGGHGVVYLAHNETVGRDVALKVLRAGFTATAEEAARFRNEAAVLAALSHPNIVTLHSTGHFEGHSYLEMEYLSGRSLSDQARVDVAEVGIVARGLMGLACALEVAHQAGIIHRDIKPANVVLTADGTPKITDFGLASNERFHSWPTPTAVTFGTPGYLAPELASGKSRSATPAADIYGLGAVGYYWLTGQPPFAGTTPYDTVLLSLTTDAIPLRKLRRSVPVDLESIIHKCLDPDAGRRYRSAGELGDDLERFLSGKPVTARPLGVVRHTIRWGRRNPAAAVLSLALIGIVLAALGVTTVLWRRAAAAAELSERRREQARVTLRQYTAIAQRTFATSSRLAAADREALARVTLEVLDQLEQDRDDPELERKTAWNILQIANVTQSLGDLVRAEQLALRAEASLRRLWERDPNNNELKHEYAQAVSQRGHHLRDSGRTAEAERAYLAAETLMIELLNEQPNSDHVRTMLGSVRGHAALLHLRSGRYDEAYRLASSTINDDRKLLFKYPKDPYRHQHTTTIVQIAAYASIHTLGSTVECERLYADWLADCERLRVGNADWFRLGTPWRSWMQLAMMLNRCGRVNEARSAVNQSVKLLRAAVSQEPKLRDLQLWLAEYLIRSGDLCWNIDPKSASRDFRDAVEILRELIREEPSTNMLTPLAEILADCPDESLRNPAEALLLSERGIAIDPQYARAHAALVRSLTASGRYREALNVVEKHSQTFHTENPFALVVAVECHLKLGEREIAIKKLNAIVSSLSKDWDLWPGLMMRFSAVWRLAHNTDPPTIPTPAPIAK
jgi:tetratricopeptide (TPR) repeat protein